MRFKFLSPFSGNGRSRRTGKNTICMAVLAATSNREALKLLWEQEGIQVTEAHTTNGINNALDGAQLVLFDPSDVQEVGPSLDCILRVVHEANVPTVSSAAFLANPGGWLREGQAFQGDLTSLPPRLIAYTSMASGGVGKTTLSLTTAFSFHRRTRLPVAIMELTHGASGLLAVLQTMGRFSAVPADAYEIATQGAGAATWSGMDATVTVIPMAGRHASLLPPADFAALVERIRAAHILTIVDALQPHPLWSPICGRVDRMFIVASAIRPDTVVNAQLLAAEPEMQNAEIIINMASQTDRIAARFADQSSRLITLPRKTSIAQYTDDLQPLTARIWPGSKLN